MYVIQSVCLISYYIEVLCILQVIDFSQHHLELVSREEYARPPARPPDAREYGLIQKKEGSMYDHACVVYRCTCTCISMYLSV